MKKTFIFVGMLIALLLGLNSSSISASSMNEKDMFYLDPVREYAPGEVESWYVRYKADQKIELANTARQLGGEVIYDLSMVDTLVINLPSQAIQSLSTNRAIAFYEPVPQHQLLESNPGQFATDAPDNAPMSGRVEVLPWNIDQYQAREIWDQNFDGIVDPGAPTGAGVKFCIIDTGLWREHEDFDWSNITGFSQITGQAWDTDGNGHGTHVAGTANAVQNGYGVVGVAPGGMELHIVKIFNNDGVWVAGQSNLGTAAQNCRDNGANVLSMSLGGGYSATEEAIFQALYDNNNILNIAAAGNDGNTVRSYPASYDSVISVAAIDRDEVVADFSQYPTTTYDPNTPPANVEWDVVELSGGGVNVLSTWPAPPNTDVPRYEVNTIDSSNNNVNAIEETANGSASNLLVDGGLCDSTNGAWNGRIVLCERGTVSFANKVNNARNSGGLAVIIFNNEPGELSATCGGGCTQPSIPAVGMSQADGLDLRNNYLNTTVEVVSDDGSNCPTCVGGYNAISGTSMATPGVAAAVGFTWAACGGDNNLNITNKDIRQLLRDSARDLSGIHAVGGAYGAGWDRMTGWGLVQLKDALDLGTDRFGAQNCPPVGEVQITPFSMDVCTANNPSVNFAVIINRGDFTGNYDMSANNVPAGASSSFSPNPILNPNSATTFTLSGLNNAAAGSHNVTVIATDASDPSNQSQGFLPISLSHQTPSAPVLIAPANSSSNVAIMPQFTWNAVAGAASYSIEIATDAGFSNIIDSDTGLTGPNYTPDSPLAYATSYYWRVSATNVCGDGAASGTFSFTTMDEPSEIIACNANLITIPSSGAATPYPSPITVAGAASQLDSIKVHLSGLNHTFPDDIDILLVGPAGQNLIIMSDVGGGAGLVNVNLIFDDAAATQLPDSTQIASGTYRPTNIGTGDTFPAPAPAPSAATQLAVFNDTDPNGQWQLFVVDDAAGDSGSISGGWCVEIVSSDPPSIAVDPTSISGGQVPDVQTNHPLTITNAGEADLIWTIDEALPATILGAPSSATGSRESTSSEQEFPSAYLPLADISEGFENVANLPGWATQNNPDSPGITAWFQGVDTVFPAHSGAPTSYIAANFDNTGGSQISNWLMTPQVSFTASSSISFWTRGTGSTYPDRLQVRVSTAGASANVGATSASVGDFTNLELDINPTLTVDGYPTVWTQYTIDLSAYAGDSGRVAFRYYVPTSAGPTGNNSDYIGIDTVEFVETVSVCDTPTDLLWLAVSSSNGATAGGGNASLTVTFDSTGLTDGEYNGTLCVNSNDPVTPQVQVPVTLTVESSAEQVIELQAGWNIISSYVMPDNPNMEDVMANIVDDVLLVKNGAGQVYWPGFFNGIGDWQVDEGYLVQMAAPRTLTIVGQAVSETSPMILDAGWHAIPYLRATNMDAEIAFASIDGSFTLVKNSSGQVYWPGFFNGIGDLVPGQGYLIQMTQTDTLTYPAND